jgi:hypothetical protein
VNLISGDTLSSKSSAQASPGGDGETTALFHKLFLSSS